MKFAAADAAIPFWGEILPHLPRKIHSRPPRAVRVVRGAGRQARQQNLEPGPAGCVRWSACVFVCLSACGEVRANRASPCAAGVGVAVPRRSTIARLRSGASGARHHPAAQRPLGFGRVLRHRCTLARFGSRHLSTPPPHIRLVSAMRHPSANAACRPWSEYLPSPCNAALAAPVVSRRRIRSGPVAEAPRPLRAKGTVASSAARGLHAARLTWAGHTPPKCASRKSPPHPPRWKRQRSKTPCFSLRSRMWRRRHEAEQARTAGRDRRRGCGRAARREGRQHCRPTKRSAPQARTDGAPYAGRARGSRRCAAGTDASSALTECAGREMPAPTADPATQEGLHGEATAPERNLAIAERCGRKIRRPLPHGG